MGNRGSKQGDYQVLVKTADRNGAGTDANIYIALINTNGKRSKDYKLDIRFHDDFEQGNQDMYPISLKDFGVIDKIELWRDRRIGIGNNNWCVEWIIVRDNVRDEVYEFPINRWITAGLKRRWSRYDSKLPQNDSEHAQRKKELEEKRQVYEFEQKIDGIPVQAVVLPKDEAFTPNYMKFIITTKLKMKMHTELIMMSTKKFKTLEDMEDVYRYSFHRPEGVDGWDNDLKFGNLVMNGCNPNVIQLCTEIPNNFGVTAQMVESFLEGKTLDECLQNKRIFIVNHKVLEGVQNVTVPIGLFYANVNNDLIPIAIQLYQEKGPENPVFLPSDPKYTWVLAKMWFNLGDASYHEACTHLAFTHFILESISVAVNRHLSPSHPLYRLVAPHLHFVMAINHRGLGKLLAKGGAFDVLFSMGLKGTFALIANAFKTWSFTNNGILPANLKHRRLDDPEVLTKYYYREDGLKVWDAIRNYVDTIVKEYYTTDDDIGYDFELQGFRATLVRSIENGGCGFQDVPGVEDGITTTDQIVDIFTMIIFTASGGHASTNFGQYDQYGFPPNYPALLRGKPPNSKEKEYTEQDVMAALPTKDTMLSSMTLSKLLSTKNTESLGEYETQFLYDQTSVNALRTFKRTLNEIGKEINVKNRVRTYPYVRFHPDNIPNDISI
ncbi:allene oxide synthase-lipoxygenase protein-like [Antedon mediterranea]|uniref:allene oxide synthase-lipoxygenase protein-like n=1 Tax=Antedon mediterranea TaxID=105859 RepID=UPI003AF4CEB3